MSPTGLTSHLDTADPGAQRVQWLACGLRSSLDHSSRHQLARLFRTPSRDLPITIWADHERGGTFSIHCSRGRMHINEVAQHLAEKDTTEPANFPNRGGQPTSYPTHHVETQEEKWRQSLLPRPLSDSLFTEAGVGVRGAGAYLLHCVEADRRNEWHEGVCSGPEVVKHRQVDYQHQ